MENQSEHIARLIKKLSDGSISKNERLELNTWIEQNPSRKKFIEQLNEHDSLFEDALEWIELEQQDKDPWIEKLTTSTIEKIHKLNDTKPKNRNIFNIKWLAAALILLFSLFSIYYFNYQKNEQKINNKLALENVKPGKYQANLLLPNGENIALSEDEDLLVISNDQTISYGSGKTILDLTEKFKPNENLSIEIPRAGHYKVQLQDGSKIWLNSESKINFPIKFSNERSVSLSGEAYFQVKKTINKSKNLLAFRVQTEGQSIEVTGTEFNVYAFKNESIKTTLVEGKVNIHSALQSISLIPNEQSILSNGGLEKSTIDVSTEISWKNNVFHFDETSLKSAMKQLSRWYDLEIIYKEGIPDSYFYGQFSRDQPLQEVLKILEEADVKFEFEFKNNKNYLIVLPQT